MTPISVSLFCRKLNKKAIVYCYLIGNGIAFNGCDEMNACAACSLCKREAEKIAVRELLSLQGHDLPLDKP